jgi:toxin ParE1/3/4
VGKALEVLLTRGAEQDLGELHAFIATAESPARADAVLERLITAIERLQSAPVRGAQPPELLALGIREYRQLVVKPWRIVYRLIGSVVYVYLVADSRRDLRSLLLRRILVPGS